MIRKRRSVRNNHLKYTPLLFSSAVSSHSSRGTTKEKFTRSDKQKCKGEISLFARTEKSQFRGSLSGGRTKVTLVRASLSSQYNKSVNFRWFEIYSSNMVFFSPHQKKRYSFVPPARTSRQAKSVVYFFIGLHFTHITRTSCPGFFAANPPLPANSFAIYIAPMPLRFILSSSHFNNG